MENRSEQIKASILGPNLSLFYVKIQVLNASTSPLLIYFFITLQVNGII